MNELEELESEIAAVVRAVLSGEDLLFEGRREAYETSARFIRSVLVGVEDRLSSDNYSERDLYFLRGQQSILSNLAQWMDMKVSFIDRRGES